MLKPLTIGKKHFDTNLIQAPLAGISCAPFRDLVWQFGGVAYCCTEMLSAQHVAIGIDRSPRYNVRFPSEKTLCWQLSGNNADILARASERAVLSGADLLDLNCGCPQPKIRKKNCGSQLLSDEKKLFQLVKAMRVDEKIPVTVKMRVDASHGEFCEIAVAKIIEEAGADAIIVHGRHWTHDYDVPAQWDAISAIVSAVNIPVIANGDITDSIALEKVFKQTHCAGFMIARESVGQPWLFKKISEELKGKKFELPSQLDIGQLFLKHAQGLIELDGEHNAIFQCRKLGKYYARGLENKIDFINALYISEHLSEVVNITQQFFG